jgi:hypothetical protein
MRFAGRIEPGSGVGGTGHFSNCLRPNATADANATESCLLRLGTRCGVIVSGLAATWGGATADFVVVESMPLPSGGDADSCRASCAMHETTIEIPNRVNARPTRSSGALLFGTSKRNLPMSSPRSVEC